MSSISDKYSSGANGASVIHFDKKVSQRKSEKCLVHRTRKVFQTERTKSLSFRKTQLKHLVRCLQEEEEAFCEALYKDLRKSSYEAINNEIIIVIKEALNAIKNLEEWCKPQSVDKTILNMFDSLMVYSEPYGVVLVIGTWNYPINVLLLPVVGKFFQNISLRNRNKSLNIIYKSNEFD